MDAQRHLSGRAAETHRHLSSRDRAGVLVTAAVVALVVIVYGGYGGHWLWTGINIHTASLWEWLKLLLLPVVFALLPLSLGSRRRLQRRARSLVLAGGALFLGVVLAGYLVPWAWTGFVGNRLWEWLNLIALPVAVALVPAYGGLRSSWSRRDSMIVLAGALVFAVIVVCGYVVPWRWTGFTGNTLWDWLHLVLLPLLVPIVVVPVLTPKAVKHIEVVGDSDSNATADRGAPPAASGQAGPLVAPDAAGSLPTVPPAPPPTFAQDLRPGNAGEAEAGGEP